MSRIGIHDDFFELGGHSLKATQVAVRVRREYDVTASVREIFSHPTVAGLAGYIENARWVVASGQDEASGETDDDGYEEETF